jgi:hypothetical protein
MEILPPVNFNSIFSNCEKLFVWPVFSNMTPKIEALIRCEMSEAASSLFEGCRGASPIMDVIKMVKPSDLPVRTVIGTGTWSDRRLMIIYYGRHVLTIRHLDETS